VLTGRVDLAWHEDATIKEQMRSRSSEPVSTQGILARVWYDNERDEVWSSFLRRRGEGRERRKEGFLT
jgi:hypothetical protein